MIAAARLAALRQQGATAQAGLAALSASTALSLGQPSARHPSENAWLGIVESFVRHQHHQSFPRSDPVGQVHQPTRAASRPPLAHGYVASAQPEPVEEEPEVMLWINHEHSDCGKIMRCVCAYTASLCPVTSCASQLCSQHADCHSDHSDVSLNALKVLLLMYRSQAAEGQCMGRRSRHSAPCSSTILSSPLHQRALGSSCEPTLCSLPVRYVQLVGCCATQQMQHLSI